mmetsp:Transcript_6302/g.19616  ORF Transcript_6302/g.19616 Transcript_6302/m.19616 type:complete len:436 (+) Transcript_6302:61-1368(+)
MAPLQAQPATRNGQVPEAGEATCKETTGGWGSQAGSQPEGPRLGADIGARLRGQLCGLVLVGLLALLLHSAADPPHLLDRGLPCLALLRGLAPQPCGDNLRQLHDTFLLALRATLLASFIGLLLHCFQRWARLLDHLDTRDPARPVGEVAERAEDGLTIPRPRLVLCVLARGGVLGVFLPAVVLLYDCLGLLDHPRHVVVLALHWLIDRLQLLSLGCLPLNVLVQDALAVFQRHVALDFLIGACTYLLLTVLLGHELLKLTIVKRREAVSTAGMAASPATAAASTNLLLCIFLLRLLQAGSGPGGAEEGEVRQVLVNEARGAPEDCLLRLRQASREHVFHLLVFQLLILLSMLERPEHLRLVVVRRRLQVQLLLRHLLRSIQEHAANSTSLASAAHALQMLVVVVAILGKVAIPVQLGGLVAQFLLLIGLVAPAA